ncbi:MAG: excinuclease ABC subunit A, partial [Planctomycetes bacterium]|nr:excinuclease ABC subunit A [Planctomycetota bacterium]
VTVLQRLVGKGNTAIVIEHNLDVIKCADWLIDLGPEGGDGGGQIVAEGPPAEVAKTKGSYTGHFLKRYFKTNLSAKRKRAASSRSKKEPTKAQSATKKKTTKTKTVKKSKSRSRKKAAAGKS